MFDDLVAGGSRRSCAGPRLAGRGMKAEVLTIGDELLRGEIVDSNKSFLSERLLALDIETHYHASVRDVPDGHDRRVPARGRARDIVLVSGGLGPTRDDLTSEVLGAGLRARAPRSTRPRSRRSAPSSRASGAR